MPITHNSKTFETHDIIYTIDFNFVHHYDNWFKLLTYITLNLFYICVFVVYRNISTIYVTVLRIVETNSLNRLTNITNNKTHGRK